MKILVIIPAYNEQDNIIKIISELQSTNPTLEYIVINDCSTDNTKELLEKHRINYIDLPVNLGIGGCVQTGYIYANKYNFDIAIQLDGDGQHNPTYITSLLEPILNGEADAVIGSRFINNLGFQSSFLRRLGIEFLSELIFLICGTRIKDVTSGYRVVNKKGIELFAKEYAQDYPEPEAIVEIVMNNLKIVEVPVEMNERQGGTSSISSWKSLYYIIKVSIAIILKRIAGTGVQKK